jgi:small-conductance mechanosensitive channel
MARAIEMLDTTYWGNSVRSYLIATGVVLAILLAVRISRQILIKRVGALARRTETRLDDTVVGMVSATKLWLAVLIALYAGSLFLVLPVDLAEKIQTAAVIALLVQIGVWTTAAIIGTVRRLREKKMAEGDTAGIGILAMMGFFGRVVTWVVLLLLILDNLGVDVTALVAGLGIGGIAIALAVQSVLQDLFASISIMLDRPFEIGDMINVDGLIGRVQHIGVKTTRVRSLDGEELVFANADLLKSRIRNYRTQQERRVLFLLGVNYDTPIELLEQLPGMLRDLIQREEKVRFDRAHFKAFGQSSLDFEMIYFVTTPDYLAFMDIQQRFHLDLLRQLRSLGVSIAFPTRTLHVEPAEREASAGEHPSESLIPERPGAPGGDRAA